MTSKDRDGEKMTVHIPGRSSMKERIDPIGSVVMTIILLFDGDLP